MESARPLQSRWSPGRPAAVVKPRVIIADDSEELTRLLSGVLERSGFDVTSVADGIDLLSRMGIGAVEPDARYDVIVLDIRMPLVDGLHVLRLLRSLGDAPPIIAMSAFGSYGALDQARALGAAATFDKPFDLYRMRDAIAAFARPASRAP